MYQPQPGQQMQQQQNPQQQQRKDQQQQQQQFMSAEAQAREKLSHYVYEYLVHMGAVKSADVFKSEVLAQNGNGGLQVDSLSSPPGFLFNWFSVFWDLYSAHPDKKEKAEASNDAKAYHKMMMPGCGFPEGLVNGGIYGPPGFPNAGMGPLGAPPPQNLPDGMFPGGFYNGPRAGGGPPPSQSSQASPIPGGPRYSQQGTRSGAPTPVGIGNNNFPAGHGQPPPQMNALGMNEQQMRLAMIQHQQRQAQAAAAAAAAATQQGRLHMNLPPAGGPQGKQIRAQFGGPAPGQYMDSPTGTPPFASNPLGHNGTAGGQSLMSPGASAAPGSQQGVPGVSAGGPMPGGEVGPGSQESAARFMMIGAGGGGMPQQQFMNHHDAPGASTTRTPGPGSVSAGGMNPNGGAGSMGGTEGENGNNGNSSGGAAGSSQLHSLLNGTADMQLEMKQSPAFSGGQMGGVGVGTPISASSAGAGPGSVHSQSGGGGNNSQQHSQQQQQTPISEAMDIGGHLGSHQSDEISKIKASLMEGYSNSRDYD